MLIAVCILGENEKHSLMIIRIMQIEKLWVEYLGASTPKKGYMPGSLVCVIITAYF